jgi:Family of unknown function (DUF6263)
MMPFSPIRLAALVAALMFALPGCGYFQSKEADLDDEFGEVGEDGKKSKDDDVLAGLTEDPEGELGLKVKQGDRFPLIKRIEQRLTQASGEGMLVNRSVTELLLSLVVEEIKDGNKRFGVRYHRVRYGHNIAGRKVEYNSDSSDQMVPPEVMAYAGLKDNGFSFWIGPNNRVIEVEGFNEFLQRCVQNVPSQYRDAVLKQLLGAQGEDGLANFVDDGIGLLPYSEDPNRPAVSVKVGSVWELARRKSEGPIPMNISTRCLLKSLDEKSAEISLIGTITGSSTPVTVQNSGQKMRVQVKGGNCNGSCTVDRRTGLPTHSEVNRYIEMVVQVADGTEIQQRKEVITSITSYLEQTPPQQPLAGSTLPPSESPFERAVGARSESSSNRVTPAGGISSSSSVTRPRGETPKSLSPDFGSNFQKNLNR